MRIHKFTTKQGEPIWIDLDQVHAVRSRDGRTTEILMHSWTHLVDLEVIDVLALVSPPAAPDTYEQELRERINKLGSAMAECSKAKATLTDIPEHILRDPVREALRAARLDEIERFEKAVLGAYVAAAERKPITSWFENHINARRAELEA